MAINITLPVREDVQGYPDNDKAVMVNARGKIRVVERQYYWDKEKRRGLEKRKYLGYVVDGKFYSNESYKKKYKRNGSERLVKPRATKNTTQGNTGLPRNKPVYTEDDILSRQRANELPLYYAAAEETGLVEDLTNVFGETRAKAMLSIAFHWLSSGDNAGYLFDSWKDGRLLPYTNDISSREMSEFFRELNNTPSWQKDFFSARLNRLPEDEMLSYDATQIATEAEKIDYAKLGMGKSGGVQKQVGLILLVGHKTNMPVLFKVLPGNITNVTTVQDMLYHFDEINEYGKRIFAAVVDRGYFSLKNLASFIDHGSRVIMAAKTDVNWVKDVIDEANSTPWGSENRVNSYSCFGKTFPLEKVFQDGQTRKIWVHVYYSASKKSIEELAFYQQLSNFEEGWIYWDSKSSKSEDDKKDDCPLLKDPLMKYYIPDTGILGKKAPERNHEAINKMAASLGFFANVTTMECSASDALENYKARDLIEKTFKAGKSLFDMDCIRSHDDNTMAGRMIISFVTLSIINHIYMKMNMPTTVTQKNGKEKTLKPLIQKMTFKQLKNTLSGIRLTRYSDGVRRWTETTSKQHEIAQRMGYPNLYVDIPAWG